VAPPNKGQALAAPATVSGKSRASKPLGRL
jgi:hypothetical protein